MNEIVFLGHVAVVLGFALAILRLGRDGLVAGAAMLAVVSNFFVLKQIRLLSFEVTAADAYMIGSMLCLNLLYEYWGKKAADKGLRIAFFCMIFFAVFAQVHLRYQPSALDKAHPAYLALLSPSVRIVIASITAYIIAQVINLAMFGFMKRMTPKLSLGLRSTISMMFSQLVDTYVFVLLGLYGLLESVWQIAALSFTIKVITILIAAPITALTKKMVNHDILSV